MLVDGVEYKVDTCLKSQCGNEFYMKTNTADLHSRNVTLRLADSIPVITLTLAGACWWSGWSTWRTPVSK